MPDLVRVKLESGAEASVGAAFAESHGLKVLNKPALRHGRALRTKFPVDLKGAALDAALDAAGLPKSGSADEKRQRLSDHQLSVAPVVGTATPTTLVGESDTSKEDSK